MQDLQLFTYTAPTSKEAMEIVTKNHGKDAMIVNSRELKKKTLLESGLYEIVVVDEKPKDAKIAQDAQESGDDLPDNAISKRLEQIAQKEIERRRAEKRDRENQISYEISNAVREISRIAQGDSAQNRRDSAWDSQNSQDSRDSTKNRKGDARIARDLADSSDSRDLDSKNLDSKYNPLTQTREMLARVRNEENGELKNIKSLLEKLADKMKLLQNMLWNDVGVRVQSTNAVPHEFAEIYRICKNSGMKSEHLDELMQQSQQLMPLNMRENSQMIKRFFSQVLRRMIPCRAENTDMKQKRVIMLVGPTGVGKTTTIAKLASHYSLKHNYKVGLITIDEYRIGAFEQLAFYAKKLKASINRAVDTTEFERSLEDFRYCDYILIDTIGSSQNDKQKLDILRRFANADYNIDVNLVLSANTKFEDLRDIYNAFNILNIDTLIFSKLDESNGFGNIFSLIKDTQKPVSYFTIGQEVPEDILAAKNDYLADCIINGFSKPKRDSIIR